MKSAPLDGMTQARWDAFSEGERRALRDLSGLSPQLLPYTRHERVQAERLDGTIVRFYVGRSTGWRPCHLEIKTSRSYGGSPADLKYRSVQAIPRPRQARRRR